MMPNTNQEQHLRVRTLSPNFRSKSLENEPPSPRTSPIHRLSPSPSLDGGDKSPQHRKTPKRQGSFTMESGEMLEGTWDLDSKEAFRKILLDLYKEQSKEKEEGSYVSDENDSTSTCRTDQLKDVPIEKSREEYTLTKFIRYMSIEHEYLLTLVIFCPLLMTTIYIAFIE